MAAIWNNFVQSTTTSSTGPTSTTIDIAAAISPWETPPDPAGGVSYATLTDSTATPTYFEVVKYTGRTGTGPYTLTGVTRALEGTSARTWPIGTIVMQYISAAELVDETSLAAADGDSEINAGTF